jgi:hypothetical protein
MATAPGIFNRLPLEPCWHWWQKNDEAHIHRGGGHAWRSYKIPFVAGIAAKTASGFGA